MAASCGNIHIVVTYDDANVSYPCRIICMWRVPQRDVTSILGIEPYLRRAPIVLATLKTEYGEARTAAMRYFISSNLIFSPQKI